MNIYWWIEKPSGLLAPYGRKIGNDGEIWESGGPTPQYYRDDIAPLCKKGEKPVKVEIRKIKKG